MLQKYLSLSLGEKDTAVISLHHVTEVLQVSLIEVCRVPQMPSSVFGIYNWRGEMLWLVDLEEMLGYAPLSQGVGYISKMMAIIVQEEEKHLGLLVRNLMDIEWLDTNLIKPPASDLVSPEILPFLSGYFINDTEEMIINLDTTTILQSPKWAIHN